MTVNYLIIHNLNKEILGDAALYLSKDALNPSDTKSVSLIENLNSRFKDNISHGVFTEHHDDATTFKTEFDKCLKKITKDEFVEFSNATAKLLYTKIETIRQARGGYLVYADYEDRGHHFFSVFFIRDKKDMQFSSRDGVITIGEIICVETDKLAMACRININSYQGYSAGGSSTYLGFVSIKQSETSDYFLNWIGAEKKKRDNEDTKALVKIINSMPVPEEDGKAMSQEGFRRKAYDAILAYNKSPLNINTVSQVLFGDALAISQFAENKGVEISTEFYASRDALRNLVSYHVKADKIDLKFPPEYYGDKIRMESGMVIIKSDIFANAITAENDAWKF
jgi:nucleoid-associated protein